MPRKPYVLLLITTGMLVLPLTWKLTYPLRLIRSRSINPQRCGSLIGSEPPLPIYPGSWMLRDTPNLAYWDVVDQEELGCILSAAATPREIQDFYAEQMTALGWKQDQSGGGRTVWRFEIPYYAASLSVHIHETRGGSTRYHLSLQGRHGGS